MIVELHTFGVREFVVAGNGVPEEWTTMLVRSRGSQNGSYCNEARGSDLRLGGAHMVARRERSGVSEGLRSWSWTLGAPERRRTGSGSRAGGPQNDQNANFIHYFHFNATVSQFMGGPRFMPTRWSATTRGEKLPTTIGADARYPTNSYRLANAIVKNFVLKCCTSGPFMPTTVELWHTRPQGPRDRVRRDPGQGSSIIDPRDPRRTGSGAYLGPCVVIANWFLFPNSFLPHLRRNSVTREKNVFYADKIWEFARNRTECKRGFVKPLSKFYEHQLP